jgi:hypothetical protein
MLLSEKVSEFPEPWHRIDPAIWPRVQERINKLISSPQTKPDQVKKLRRLEKAPRRDSRLEPDVMPYHRT